MVLTDHKMGNNNLEEQGVNPIYVLRVGRCFLQGVVSKLWQASLLSRKSQSLCPVSMILDFGCYSMTCLPSGMFMHMDWTKRLKCTSPNWLALWCLCHQYEKNMSQLSCWYRRTKGTRVSHPADLQACSLVQSLQLCPASITWPSDVWVQGSKRAVRPTCSLQHLPVDSENSWSGPEPRLPGSPTS